MSKTHQKIDKHIMIISSGLSFNSKKGSVFLLKILDIFLEIFNKNSITLTTSRISSPNFLDYSQKVNIINFQHETQKNNRNSIRDIFNFFLNQVLLIKYILKIKRHDFYFFYLCQSLILPILFLKIFNKHVVIYIGMSHYELYQSEKSLKNLIFRIFETISIISANKIVIASDKLVDNWKLNRWRYKIFYANEHFLNFNLFKITKKYEERQNIIGYVGRFSKEKGILNFTKSLPYIIKTNKNLKVYLIGNGILYDEIKKFILENNLSKNVCILDWVEYEKLPSLFNELKLLIVPSYTESGPAVTYEAMACGTPVLTTNVGFVVNYIKNNQNGFILKNNVPQTIGDQVDEIINLSNLPEISNFAYMTISKEFTFDNRINEWRKYFGIPE